MSGYISFVKGLAFLVTLAAIGSGLVDVMLSPPTINYGRSDEVQVLIALTPIVAWLAIAFLPPYKG